MDEDRRPTDPGDAGETPARLIERAIRERWPIPDDFRAAAVRKLMKVLLDANASPRAVVAATRALGQLDRLNLDQSRLDFDRTNATPPAPNADIDPAVAEAARHAALEAARPRPKADDVGDPVP